MFLGLGVTGAVALYSASSPAIMQMVVPSMWLLLIAELLLVLGLSFAAPRLSGGVAGALFLAYATLNGLTFSTLFFVYQLGSFRPDFLLPPSTSSPPTASPPS